MEKNQLTPPARQSKLHSTRGIARLVVIMAVAVLVLAIVCMIPGYKKYQLQGKTVACAVALDSASRRLATEFMFDGFENCTAEEAKEIVTRAMLGWEDLCPDGGNIYIHKKNGVLAWELVCGLHCQDSSLRTRLNASNVRDQLREALIKERNKGNLYPETLTYTLHHKEHTAVLVDAPMNFKRGTKTTMGMEKAGTVVYYAIVGNGDFGADKGLEDGELYYVCYADEDHCAIWTADEQWTGDSYIGVSRD